MRGRSDAARATDERDDAPAVAGADQGAGRDGDEGGRRVQRRDAARDGVDDERHREVRGVDDDVNIAMGV